MTCTEQRRRRVQPRSKTRTFGSYLLGDDQPCISQITNQVPTVGDQLGGLLLLGDSSFRERQSPNVMVKANPSFGPTPELGPCDAPKRKRFPGGSPRSCKNSQFKRGILRLIVRMVAEAGIHFLRRLGFHESQLRCHHEKRTDLEN